MKLKYALCIDITVLQVVSDFLQVYNLRKNRSTKERGKET